jgi:hypothetical protein
VRRAKPRKEFAGGDGPQGASESTWRTLWNPLKYKPISVGRRCRVAILNGAARQRGPTIIASGQQTGWAGQRQPFHPEVFAREEEKMKRKKLARLQKMAASLNYQLVP